MKTFRRYFELEEQDDDLSVAIRTLGHHIHPPQTAYPDIKHPESHYFNWSKGRYLKEFQLLYISAGKGKFEANGMPPKEIEAGTVILLYPGQWHRYKPLKSTGWEEYWVGFNGAYAKHLLEQECFNPQNPILKVGFNAEYIAAFERLLDIVEKKDESYQKLTSFILIQLLGILYTSVLLSNEKIPRKERVIEEVKKYINEHWNSEIDFDELAKTHHLSYAWLRKAFKEVTDTSLHQYHLMLRLRKAEQMIQESELSLSEISYSCGFETLQYFSKMFKAKFLINPSAIRKNKGSVN
ncbi:MAG: AraC family transcriptional regulator [Sphingobacteriaceae bacterium]